MPLAMGAALIAILATAAYALGLIALSGAITGTVISFAILACTGLPGFIILLAFYPAATYAAHASSAMICALRERRSILNALHPRRLHGIRRTGWQVLANAGVPALLAVLHFIATGVSPLLSAGWSFAITPSPYFIAMCATLASAAADTASHEVGEALRSATYNPITWKRVQPGETGGVSIAGSLIALAVITAFTALAIILRLTPTVLAAMPIAIGGIAGNVADTLIGALVESKRRRWGNNSTNLAASVTAAVTAVLCALCVS